MAKLTDYTVKGVKSFEGMEGLGFNATLYREGRKVATVIDDASGGEVMFRWLDEGASTVKYPHHGHNGETRELDGTPEEALFAKVVFDLPSVESHGMTLHKSEGWVVSDLVNEYEDRRWLRRNTKTKTLFRLKGEEAGSYRTINSPYGEKVVEYIMGKYGDKVELIVNPTEL